MTQDISTWNPTHAQNLVLTDPGTDLAGYLRAIRRLPKLSAEQENELARQFQQHQDLRAAQQLVMCNLRHVVPIARGYRGYGLPEADLIQEGSIGLMKAVKRFDPEAGVRLMTFASHWIRAEIHEFVLRNWRLVKMATTKAQRKLFFKLRSHKASLEALNETQAARIAEELAVRTSDVLEMDARLMSRDVAVALPSENDDDDQPIMPLVDARYVPEDLVLAQESEQQTSMQVHQALSALNARERQIIEARILNEDKATLAELAETFGVSIERIRQIEAAALKKLRTQLQGFMLA